MSGMAGVTQEPETRSMFRRLAHRALVLGGGLAFTVLLFFVLPLMQAIGKKPMDRRPGPAQDLGYIPPPPPPPEEEIEDEPEEEEPPKLEEDVRPLDLSQLELALNAGSGGSWVSGNFGIKLDTQFAGGAEDATFSITDLDQRPRAVYQANPVITAQLRRRAPGTVSLICIVDENGRVQNPKVRKSSDPIFERAALNAFKKWKYEPGRRNGKPVRFRISQKITFPAQ